MQLISSIFVLLFIASIPKQCLAKGRQSNKRGLQEDGYDAEAGKGNGSNYNDNGMGKKGKKGKRGASDDACKELDKNLADICNEFCAKKACAEQAPDYSLACSKLLQEYSEIADATPPCLPSSTILGANFKFFTDSFDPRTLEATLPDTDSGDKADIKFYGTKDGDDNTVTVGRFYVDEESGTVRVELDKENRIQKLFNSEDGYEMSLIWETNTTVIVQVKFEEKQYTARIDTTAEVDPGYLDQANRDLETKLLVSPVEDEPVVHVGNDGRDLKDIEITKTGDVRFRGGAQESTDVEITKKEDVIGRGLEGVILTRRVVLQLTRCGSPYDDADIRMFYDLRAGGESESGSVWGLSTGNGEYVFFIPVAIEDDIQIVKDACDKAVPAIDLVCDDLKVGGALGNDAIRVTFCASIGVAIDLVLGGPTGEGLAIAIACERGLKIANKACKIIDPTTKGKDIDLVKEICNAIEVDEPFEAVEWELNPFIVFPSSLDIPGVAAAVPGPLDTFQFGSVEIDENGKPSIESVFVSPIDPAPGQDYVFTAMIRCVDVSEGASVKLTITGTDGYTDEQTCLPPSVETESCTLGVPGADEGVYDTITVTISPAGITTSLGVIF